MKSLIFFLLLSFVIPLWNAHAIPPIPEPGIIIYGKVTDASRNTAAPITGLSWTISNDDKSIVLSVGAGIETSVLNGETWFIARVPFASTNVQGVAIDPVSNTTFETTQTPVLYSRSIVTVNDVVAQISAPAGGSFTFPASAGVTDLGRTERVDLVIPHNLGAAYSTWAVGRWGNIYAPDASPNADPDHDGQLNGFEFTAGTDPSDARSNLAVSNCSLAGDSFIFVWPSVPGKTYLIESSSSPSGPWTSVGASITANGLTTTTSRPIPPGSLRHFFRVGVAP